MDGRTHTLRARHLVVTAALVALVATALSPAAAASPRFEAQVMNGEPAAIEDLPSVVFVATSTSSCTGTLIAPRWVLTAGHCFTSASADGVDVGIGGDDLLEGFAEIVPASRVVVHEDYDANTLHADLALVELATASVAPVQQLAATGSPDPTGALATITGWGMLDVRATTDTLQKAEIPVLDDSECLRFAGYDGTTFVCAGGTGSDVCPGDSGGPLLVADDGVLTQVGVVSYGEDCDPLVSSTIGAYTAVAAYRSWIDAITSTSEPDPQPQPEPEQRFSDVPPGGTHAANIDILVNEGITGGYEDGTFKPGRSVSRAQMATFLAKALGIDLASVDTSDTGFSDVPSDHAHAPGIVAVADLGITGGYDDGTFRPGLAVTRAQMGSFLAKALGVDLETVDASDTGFPDVPSDHTHAPGIVTIADRAITGGYADGTYGPTITVNRAQMASFLVAAFDLGG